MVVGQEVQRFTNHICHTVIITDMSKVLEDSFNYYEFEILHFCMFPSCQRLSIVADYFSALLLVFSKSVQILIINSVVVLTAVYQWCTMKDDRRQLSTKLSACTMHLEDECSWSYPTTQQRRIISCCGLVQNFQWTALQLFATNVNDRQKTDNLRQELSQYLQI